MIRYDRKCRHEYNDKPIQNLFIFIKRQKILLKYKEIIRYKRKKNIEEDNIRIYMS